MRISASRAIVPDGVRWGMMALDGAWSVGGHECDGGGVRRRIGPSVNVGRPRLRVVGTDNRWEAKEILVVDVQSLTVAKPGAVTACAYRTSPMASCPKIMFPKASPAPSLK